MLVGRRLKDFVPPEYQKNKEVDKRIYAEHAKLQGLNELNAKFRYVQMSRSLKTYGTTFFVVKETNKKKKAAPVLLGITKQNIIRMDIDTKETLEEWKLTQVRRWAATAKNFTLDFGDYSDNYYSVETTEGEEISRLIAGYIDIIVKKRNQKARTIEEQRVEEQAVVEDYVRPGRAKPVDVMNSGGTARQAKELNAGTSVVYIHGDQHGHQKHRQSSMPAQGGAIAQNLDISEFQQAIIQTINNGLAVTAAAYADLSTPTHLPPLSSDPASVRWRQETCDITSEAVASNIASCLAAVGALIIHATGNTEDMDYDTIGSKLFTIISCVGQITQGMKMVAGLQVDDGHQQELLNAAKRLNETTSSVLRGLLPIISGSLIMDDFYKSSRMIAESSTDVLRAIDHLEVSDNLQQLLLEAADDVANVVVAAVEQAKKMSQNFRDPEMQQMSASDCALASEISNMLIAVTGALAPTVHIPLCREQLMEGSVLMHDATAAFLAYAEHLQDQSIVEQLNLAVEEVEDAISRLLERARNMEHNLDDEIEEYYHQVIHAIGDLSGVIDTPEQIIGHAKTLTINSTRLAEVLKSKAEELTNLDDHDALLDAAREISELTSRMVGLAKDVVKNPENDATKDGLADVLKLCIVKS
eukprot:jgi/Hompol1/6874/HPOL_002361-RA